MAREKETYRSILDRLDERFPNRELISQKDFADFLGKSRFFIYNNFEDIKIIGGYPKTSIAKMLAR